MNAQIIVALVIVAIALVCGVIWFVKLPKEKKIANIKEWLKYAVVQAEKELGSGTGQLKLRMVYDMAVNKFPFLVKLVPFNIFSGWVDESLDWMRDQLAENKAAQNYVESK